MATKAQTPAADQTAETAAVARSYFEAVARRDLDAMEAHYAPGGGGKIHGLVELRAGENYRQWFGNLFRAFPDWRFEILDLIAQGEKGAVRWRATGTFNGDVKFEGLEPNGAKVSVQGCDVVTVRNGKLIDNQAYSSGTEIARQLGVLPAQGSAAERTMNAAFNLKTWLARALGRD
jgi:predicted ester cyclase